MSEVKDTKPKANATEKEQAYLEGEIKKGIEKGFNTLESLSSEYLDKWNPTEISAGISRLLKKGEIFEPKLGVFQVSTPSASDILPKRKLTDVIKKPDFDVWQIGDTHTVKGVKILSGVHGEFPVFEGIEGNQIIAGGRANLDIAKTLEELWEKENFSISLRMDERVGNSGRRYKILVD